MLTRGLWLAAAAMVRRTADCARPYDGLLAADLRSAAGRIESNATSWGNAAARMTEQALAEDEPNLSR